MYRLYKILLDTFLRPSMLLGCGARFFDGYAAMTGSKTSFDDIITPALAGTGVFADKDASYNPAPHPSPFGQD